jgi:hypothetical protein
MTSPQWANTVRFTVLCFLLNLPYTRKLGVKISHAAMATGARVIAIHEPLPPRLRVIATDEASTTTLHFATLLSALPVFSRGCCRRSLLSSALLVSSERVWGVGLRSCWAELDGARGRMRLVHAYVDVSQVLHDLERGAENRASFSFLPFFGAGPQP